jgi:hypothetical protein
MQFRMLASDVEPVHPRAGANTGTKLYVYLIRCRVGLGGEQRTALRCDFKTISPEDAEALRQLNELRTTPGSDAKPN